MLLWARGDCAGGCLRARRPGVVLEGRPRPVSRRRDRKSRLRSTNCAVGICLRAREASARPIWLVLRTCHRSITAGSLHLHSIGRVGSRHLRLERALWTNANPPFRGSMSPFRVAGRPRGAEGAPRSPLAFCPPAPWSPPRPAPVLCPRARTKMCAPLHISNSPSFLLDKVRGP